MVVLLVTLFFKGGPYVTGSYEKGSLIQSIWAKRPLSKTALGKFDKVTDKS